jgi:hypothetical protein
MALSVTKLGELVRGDARLLQDAAQGADLQFAVQGHNATSIFAPHHDVTAALSHDNEPQPLERGDTLGSTHARQPKHQSPQKWSAAGPLGTERKLLDI